MPDRITSVQNPRIKLAVKLRARDGRDEQQRIILDGTREIARALQAGVQLVELFVCEERLRDEGTARYILRQAESLGISPTHVSRAVLEKLAYGDRQEGIVAIARPHRLTLEQVKLAPQMLVAVLAGLEKPGNLGAIVRTADAAQVSAVIVADGQTDLYNPNAIRASVGTLFTMPVIAVSSDELLAWLRRHQFQIYAARVEGAKHYAQVPWQQRIAVVLGSEAGGLGDSWSASDITSIALPMHGVADSLNVSVTAAVLFYEALRQRGAESGVRHSTVLP